MSVSVSAKRLYDAARYQKMREHKLVMAREYYERNRETVIARQTAKGHAKAIAEGREPGKSGPPRLYSDAERKARAAASLRIWRQNNPDKFRAQGVVQVGNRRARLKGKSTYIRVGDLECLWGRQKGICALCNEPFGAETPHVDHWIPLARGGSHELSNLKLLHGKCNLVKWAKLPNEAKSAISQIVEINHDL